VTRRDSTSLLSKKAAAYRGELPSAEGVVRGMSG
jgi:hypothetical protein